MGLTLTGLVTMLAAAITESGRFGVAAFAFGALVLVGHEIARRREIALRHALKMEDDEIAVRAEVFRDPVGGRRTLLGADDGALTTVDGWVVFRGLRSEWCLAAPQTGDDLANTLFFDGPDGRYSVRLFAVGPRSLDGNALLRKWRDAPLASGPARHPPTSRDR